MSIVIKLIENSYDIRTTRVSVYVHSAPLHSVLCVNGCLLCDAAGRQHRPGRFGEIREGIQAATHRAWYDCYHYHHIC